MGWNRALLNSLPMSIITVHAHWFQLHPRAAEEFKPFLHLHFLSIDFHAPLQLHWPIKPQSQHDLLSILLSNGFLCTHSYGRALWWSAWVEGCGQASGIWLYQWLSESFFVMWCQWDRRGPTAWLWHVQPWLSVYSTLMGNISEFIHIWHNSCTVITFFLHIRF